MILLCGIPSESSLALVREELEALGVPYVCLTSEDLLIPTSNSLSRRRSHRHDALRSIEPTVSRTCGACTRV